MLDVAIIGGGPAGLITAGTLKKSNPDCGCTVFEEHSNIGEPSHCAGLLNIEGLNQLGISTDAKYVLNRIKGAVFHGIEDAAVRIIAEQPKAVVVDRTLFDQFLANEAKDAGVKVLLNHRIRKVQRNNKIWLLKNNNGEFRSSFLVCAEGVSGSVTRQIDLPLPRPLTPAIQCEVENPALERTDLVHLYFNRSFAKGFFAWVIPLSNEKARVGLGTNLGKPRERLLKFLNFLGYEESSTENWQAHSVLTCGPVMKTHIPYAISVGDAAGQVKQTTGGGVIMGGICAQIAAETISNNLKMISECGGDLSHYQRKWHGLLREEFKSMQFARRVSDSLSDKALANLFTALKKYEDEITEKGDMDFQSGVIKALRSKPRLILTGMREVFLDIFRH